MPLSFFAELDAFCEWLEGTPFSQIIQKTYWIIPTIQIVHILAIAAVAGSVLMINARLLRLIDANQPLPSVARRFLPVIWRALPVLLLSGLLMIIGEPARSLKNPIFQTKVVLILLVCAHTFYLQKRLAGHGEDVTGFGRARAFATVLPALVLWVGIIFAGRWIAYY